MKERLTMETDENKISTIDELLELCHELLEKCSELDRKFADDNPFI